MEICSKVILSSETPVIPEKPLLENGVPSRLPDDQICHLLNSDTDKEGRVAMVLQNLPLVECLQKNNKFGVGGERHLC